MTASRQPEVESAYTEHGESNCMAAKKYNAATKKFVDAHRLDVPAMADQAADALDISRKG